MMYNNNIKVQKTPENGTISLDNILESALKTLKLKQKEYTFNGSLYRFSNFINQCTFIRETSGVCFSTEDMIIAGMAKHIASLICADNVNQSLTKEFLYEKIGDAFNYLAIYYNYIDTSCRKIGEKSKYDMETMYNYLFNISNVLINKYNKVITKENFYKQLEENSCQTTETQSTADFLKSCFN